MGLLDAIASRLGYARKTATVTSAPEWLLTDAGHARWSLPDLDQAEQQADLYRRLSWVQIAVSAVGRTAAAVPFSVRRRVGEELRDIPNHDFELLLQRPNPLDSRFELLEATFACRRLTGNAYWWLNRRDERSEPAEIWPILPHQIQPIPDGRQYLRGYGFWPEGIYGNARLHSPPYLLEPWEVVHFKSFNPLSRFVGLSPLEALAIDAEADLKQQAWNLNFFGEANAKVPGMLAFADPISDSDWTNIKKEIRSQSGGIRRELMMLRNAGKGGVAWIPMAMSQKDMEFLLARQFTKEQIFTVFAPGLVSILDANATEANASAGKATFIEHAVWPDLVAAGEKVTNDVLPAYGRNLAGGFDDIRVVDRQLLLAEIQEYAKFHTLDEVRKKYYGGAPLARLGHLVAAEITPATAPAAAEPLLIDQAPDAGPPRLPAPAAARWAMKRAIGEELSDDERILYDLIRPILARYGDEVAALIQAGQPLTLDALSDELRQALTSAALAAALSSFQVVAAEVGLDVEPDEVVTRASQWAEGYGFAQVAGLTSFTERVLQEAVASHARTPGMTRGQLEQLLAPAFGPLRAEAIAITETTRAAAAGVAQLQEALGARGVPMERVSRAVGDELVCAICGPLSGRPESEWPAERRGGPPYHPRCRCSVTLRRRRMA